MHNQFKVVQVIAPVADIFNGHPDTRVVNLGNYANCLFLINMGVNTGTTGRVKIYAFADETVLNQADSVAMANKQAIGYWYRSGTGSKPDLEGDWTRVEAGAEVTLLAANCVATQCIVVVSPTEVAAVMEAAGYKGGACHLNLHEAVDDPIVGSVSVVLAGGVDKADQLNALMS